MTRPFVRRHPYLRLLSMAVACVAAASTSLQAQRPPAIDTLALRAHTRFLAHDTLRGRGTGTPGERLAARYIAGRLSEMGVAAAGTDGYRQPVPLKRAEVVDAGSEIVVRRESDTTTLRHGHDFAVDMGGRGAYRDFTGEAIFAGTAGLAEAALADAGPLEGKVVVVLGTLGSAARTLLPDWTRRGVEGVVLLVPDSGRFTRYAESRERFRLVIDADVESPTWQPRIPILIGATSLTRALLAGSSLAPDALNGEQPFDALPLDRDVEARIRVRFDDVDAANVAGMIPGSDPERRKEVVVYTAHFDHLGVGSPDEDGDSIYNGFSDNAAGVAMLLAIAEAMVDDPPARSVLFLFFTGEERGLLGSTYYATEPVVPLERTAAVVNLDAGAPPAPPATWRVAGGEASTLGDLAADVARANGYEAEPTGASPNSDYWPFLRRDVPAVFLIPGSEWEGVSGAEREEMHRRWDHYHQPADEWSPDFPFAGLKRYAEFALALGRTVADSPDRPQMLSDRP